MKKNLLFAAILQICIGLTLFIRGASADLSEGLILRYTFDQESAPENGTVPDESGSGLNGTIVGSPSVEPGVFGNAFRFHKTAHILRSPNPLQGEDQFSVSLWFNSYFPTQNYKLISAATWLGEPFGNGWIIGTHYSEAWSDQHVPFRQDGGGWPRSVEFSPNEWNHLVIVFDGVRVKEYINGKLSVDVPANPVLIGSGSQMTVGAWLQYPFYNYPDLMDELRIYNRPLDEKEVITLYAQAKMYAFLESMHKTATAGLVRTVDLSEDSLLDGNALAAMAYLHEGNSVKLNQVLDFFDDFYHGQDEVFEGFSNTWDVGNGMAEGDISENGSALMLLALNAYHDSKGTLNDEYQKVTQGLISWFSEKNPSSYTASESAQVHAALEPYQSEPFIQSALTQLQNYFENNANYDDELEDVIQGSQIFGDLDGFLTLDYFNASEVWEYDYATMVNAYSPTTFDDEIDMTVSAKLLTAWNLVKEEVSENLSLLVLEASKVFLRTAASGQVLGIPLKLGGGEAIRPAVSPTAYLLFYLWDYNPFGSLFNFTVPSDPASFIQIQSFDNTIERGGQARITVRWNNMNTTNRKIRAQLENWKVSPAILAYTDMDLTTPSGRKTFVLNVAANSTLAQGCRVIAASLDKTLEWGAPSYSTAIGNKPNYGFDKGMVALALQALYRRDSSRTSAHQSSMRIADNYVQLLADEAAARKGWWIGYNVFGDVEIWEKSIPPTAVGLLTLVSHLRDQSLDATRRTNYTSAAYQVADFLRSLQVNNGISSGFYGGYIYQSPCPGGSSATGFTSSSVAKSNFEKKEAKKASKSNSSGGGSGAEEPPIDEMAIIEGKDLLIQDEYLRNANQGTDNPSGTINKAKLNTPSFPECAWGYVSTEHVFLAGHALLQFGKYLNDSGQDGSIYFNAGRDALLWAIQPAQAPGWGLWAGNRFYTGINSFGAGPVPNYNTGTADPQTHNLWGYMVLKADEDILGIDAELYNPTNYVYQNYLGTRSYRGWTVKGCRNGNNSTQNVNAELSSALYAGLVYTGNLSQAREFLESALVIQRFYGAMPAIVGPFGQSYPDNFIETNLGYLLEWVAVADGSNFLDVTGDSDAPLTNYINSISNSSWNEDTIGVFKAAFVANALAYADTAIGTDGTFYSWDSIEDQVRVVAPPAQRRTLVYRADPTFIYSESNESHSAVSDHGLTAHIALPYSKSILRANVPVFGEAYGLDFSEYRVEYGAGENPSAWTLIKASTVPQDRMTLPEALSSGDQTLYGNLATWDTGLKSYAYGDEFPKNHPVNLSGVYTLRLTVTNTRGESIEDKITVEVGEVIPNIYGGIVRSADDKARLYVEEFALLEPFQLFAIKVVSPEKARDLYGSEPAGAVYQLRPQSQRFLKPAVFEVKHSANHSDSEMPAWTIAWRDVKQGQWKACPSRFNPEKGSYQTLLNFIPEGDHYFALIPSTLVAATADFAKMPVFSENPGPAWMKPHSSDVLLTHDFESGKDEWENEFSEFGADLEIVSRGLLKGKALRLSNQQEMGNFAATVISRPFDAEEYPVLEFDYRIPENLKTNVLVKMDGRWYDIQFTDDDKEYRGINLEPIGRILNVRADHHWHYARVNILEMLKKHPPLMDQDSFVIEKIMLANWDCEGFMKLAFGKNPSGAYLEIDNLTIGKERKESSAAPLVEKVHPAPGVSFIPAAWADEVSPSPAEEENGQTNPVVENNGFVMFAHSKSPEQASLTRLEEEGRGEILRLDFHFERDEDYAGIYQLAKLENQADIRSLCFWVRGETGNEILKAGLKDKKGRESKVLVNGFLDGRLGRRWQEVKIPLSAFAGVSLSDGIENINFVVEASGNVRHGAVELAQIVFNSEASPLMLANCSSTRDLNIWGNSFWEFHTREAHIQTSVDPFGCLISFSGVNADRESFSWAGWGYDLPSVNVSAFDTVSFRMKRVNGVERPHFYLEDGKASHYVDVQKYVPEGQGWTTVEIPLSEFKNAGVDLSRLKKMTLTFEWEKMAGAVYVDDFQFLLKAAPQA